MQYLPNWPATRETLAAWWRGEQEAPVIMASAPRADATEGPWFDIWGWVRQRQNPQSVAEQYDQWAQRTFFGGAAVPSLWPNLGPGSLAACYTGFLKFDEVSQTAWFEVSLPWDEIERLELREDGEWWQYTMRIVRLAARQARGKFFVGTADIGGVLDVLASLRGTQELLFDLIREPERVQAACRKIEADFCRQYDAIDAIIKEEAGQDGTVGWMGIWGPDRHYPLQCDFCAMISPGMFEQFVLPSLRTHCQWLQSSIYHLDGPNQIPHLDYLLSIPELTGIQWVPGSGVPQCESPQWFEMYRKILGSGKRLVLQSIGDQTQILPMLEQIPHKGLLLTTWHGCEAEARALVEAVQGAGCLAK